MVGPCGLEPQTSTVSKRRDYVLPITYNAEETALVRASTAKTESLQVKLQVRNKSGVEKASFHTSECPRGQAELTRQINRCGHRSGFPSKHRTQRNAPHILRWIAPQHLERGLSCPAKCLCAGCASCLPGGSHLHIQGKCQCHGRSWQCAKQDHLAAIRPCNPKQHGKKQHRGGLDQVLLNATFNTAAMPMRSFWPLNSNPKVNSAVRFSCNRLSRKPTLVHREILCVAYDHGSINDVLQFANITGPGIR
jgi:hypothetical protein